ncbi:MAG: FecCD family ABC transporter permease [Pseudohongiellaceae bacterium]
MTKPALLLWLSLPLLLLLDVASGPTPLDFSTALHDLARGEDSISAIILAELRLPRALLAALVGSALAVAGAALQGLLRNPLASPDILGVSQLAVLSAVLVLYFGMAATHWFVLPLAAISGAALAVLMMFVLTLRLRAMHTLILAGIAISALASSFTALALNFAPNPYALQEIYYWMLGSVANRSVQDLLLALPFIGLGLALLWHARHFLDALSLGEVAAQSLGFDLRRQLWLLVPGVACCIGAAVAVSGNIGFIGLMVPHLLRPLVQSQPSRLLWLSLPGGAAAVLLADIVVQLLPGQQELQLGVVTAAVGGPFFLWLLLKKRTWFV